MKYAHTLTTRPPMPYWALNTMQTDDLRAIYRFVTSLGAAGVPAPTALAPGVEAKGPVVSGITAATGRRRDAPSRRRGNPLVGAQPRRPQRPTSGAARAAATSVGSTTGRAAPSTRNSMRTCRLSPRASRMLLRPLKRAGRRVAAS